MYWQSAQKLACSVASNCCLRRGLSTKVLSYTKQNDIMKSINDIGISSSFILEQNQNKLQAPVFPFVPSKIPILPKISPIPKQRIQRIIETPPTKITDVLQDPVTVLWAPIEDPTKIEEKKAARLIIIRRRKMRRHKLRKLRKKMKFVWAKLRHKRELKKEKLFQAELMAQIKEAEKFSAEVYALEKIQKANEVPLPKLWKGKRLPEFLIKQLIEEKKIKHAKYLARVERRKNMSFDVSDYNV